MDSANDSRRLVYRIAQAYYDEELTQADIAERFGISRIKVSRLLTRAREDGVVRITVVPPADDNTALERELEQIFGLQEALVVTPSGAEYTDVIEAIGRAAGDYVGRVLDDGQTLGLTWGNSVLATVDSIPHATLPSSRVVQLLGGLGLLEAEIHGAELARRAGVRSATVDRDGMFHDVDTFTDLAALHEVEVGAATAALLPRLLGRQQITSAG